MASNYIMDPHSINVSTSQKLKDLKILSFNVEGLDSILMDPEFTQLTLDHHICLLVETMRKDDTKLNLEGFWDDSLVRSKCEKIGRYSGGITVLVKSVLRKGIKVVHKSEGILWLRLDRKFFHFEEDLYICAVYIAPVNSTNAIAKRTDYFNDLTVTTNKYMNMGNVLLAGDFNSRVGSEDHDDDQDLSFISHMLPVPEPTSEIPRGSSCDQVINPNGRKLIHFCQSMNLKIGNGRCPGNYLGNFTCFANKGASVVDYLISDCQMLSKVKCMKVLPPDFTSVHTPISTTLSCHTTLHDSSNGCASSLPRKIIWDPEKIDEYLAIMTSPETKQKLKLIDQELSRDGQTLTETNSVIAQFSDLVVSGAKSCMRLAKIPQKQRPPSNNQSPRKKDFKWYSKECEKLKRRLQNNAKLLQRQPKDPYVRGVYCQAKKEYRKAVKGAKRTFEQDAIKTLEEKASNPKEFWKYLKTLGRQGQSKGISPSSEDWVEHFSSLYSGNCSVDSTNAKIVNTVKSLDEKLKDPSGIEDQNFDPVTAPFEEKAILDGIQRLKVGKAVASDLISNDILKATAKIIAPTLVLLFNRILKNEYPPEIWGLGIIVPLYKAGDSSDVNNYRGITINSCLSKLFMLLLNDRLQTFCDKENIILYNQIGFRKCFRPADHVFTLKTLIDQSFSEKKELFTCFVDFKKAYDTVWRDGLFYKLLENGLSRKFVRLLRNIYSASSLCVKVPGGRSITFPSSVGLKQGCNMSPLLFNLFINDFLVEINGPQISSPFLGSIPVNALFYADDLVLISESKEGLQMLLNKLHAYTQSWCLQVNRSKTKCVVFSSKKKRSAHVVNFGGSPLITAEQYHYLGTSFSRNGSLNDAGHTLRKKSLKALNGLFQRVYKFKSCNPTIMADLFDKMILPVALYNSEVWGTMCLPANEKNTDLLGVSSQKNPVEDIQIKFCKRMLGVNDRTSNLGVTSELGRYPTIIIVIEKMIKFWDHLRVTESPILHAAFQTNMNLDASGKRVWFTYLKRCLKFCKNDHILYTCDNLEVKYRINKIKHVLRTKASSYWTETMSNLKQSDSSKMNLFTCAKTKFGYSEYLSQCTDFNTRRALTKFRISAHNLPVEIYRYIEMDRDDRICPFCSLGIGDETHYLVDCQVPLFSEIRKPLFDVARDISPEFSSMSSRDKTIFLLGCPIPKMTPKVGKFCSKIIEIFKEFNNKSA